MRLLNVNGLALILLLQLTGGQRVPAVPNCTATGEWPTSLAFAALKNDGTTDNSMLDFTRTTTRRLASEEIGSGLFRQVHHVTFTETLGRTVQVITVSDASMDQCSISAVDVYVIGRIFRQTSP